MDLMLQWLRLETERLGIKLEDDDLQWIRQEVEQNKRLLSEHRLLEEQEVRSPYDFVPD